MADDTNIVSEPSKVITPATNPTGSTDSTIDELQAQIKQLQQDAKDKDALISQLHEHILSIETEPKSNNKKR